LTNASLTVWLTTAIKPRFSRRLNENFYKKYFQTLWATSTKVCIYRGFRHSWVDQKAVAHIDENLFVSQLQYTVSTGEQNADMEATSNWGGDAFETAITHTATLRTRKTVMWSMIVLAR
jgi:type III restriction enzyme